MHICIADIYAIFTFKKSSRDKNTKLHETIKLLCVISLFTAKPQSTLQIAFDNRYKSYPEHMLKTLSAAAAIVKAVLTGEFGGLFPSYSAVF